MSAPYFGPVFRNRDSAGLAGATIQGGGGGRAGLWCGAGVVEGNPRNSAKIIRCMGDRIYIYQDGPRISKRAVSLRCAEAATEPHCQWLFVAARRVRGPLPLRRWGYTILIRAYASLPAAAGKPGTGTGGAASA